MFLGAVFEREIGSVPKTRGLFVARAVYGSTLLAIVATCWLVVTDSQSITTAGDTARFGATLLRILAPLQLALATLAAAMTAAVAVTSEKDRRTLELLLVSRLSDRELVLGTGCSQRGNGRGILEGHDISNAGHHDVCTRGVGGRGRGGHCFLG